jgi:hypothetical protein
MGGKKRGAAGSSKTAQQQRLTSFALPLLKKPMEVIGKQVGVKGAYWDGRQTDEEKACTFMCSVVDYSISHKFRPSEPPMAAFRMQQDTHVATEEGKVCEAGRAVVHALPWCVRGGGRSNDDGS